MRLIDADTLKLNFLHLQEHIIQAYGEIDEYVRCLDNAIETYIDVNYFRSIEEAPTIDATPVVHGHWTESKEHFYTDASCQEWTNYYCSHCDAPSSTVSYYCPNCGAKMDEVSE